jgi:hypothetical protein
LSRPGDAEASGDAEVSVVALFLKIRAHWQAGQLFNPCNPNEAIEATTVQGVKQQPGLQVASRDRHRDRERDREGGAGRKPPPQAAPAENLPPQPEAPRLILGAKPGGGGSATPAGGAGSGGVTSGVRKQTVCKFVTERFQFVGVGDALKLLNDNTDFTVIAVLGLAGAGKSAILNDLATMTASWGGAGGGGLDRGLPRKPFAVQTEDILLDASHQTVGVDMHVTDERLILLDCQPLLSASVVLNSPPPP